MSELSHLPATTKGRDARERLKSAACDLFGRKGYAGVRVADITAAAGLSSGAFYRYFADRHGLLLILLNDMVDRAFVMVHARWDADDPVDSVRLTTRRYLAFYAENRALMGVLVELSLSDPKVRSIWQDSREMFYKRISRALARGVRAGSVRRDIDIDVAAEMLGSMTEFYAFQRFSLGGGALKDVTEEVATEVLTAIWSDGVTLT